MTKTRYGDELLEIARGAERPEVMPQAPAEAFNAGLESAARAIMAAAHGRSEISTDHRIVWKNAFEAEPHMATFSSFAEAGAWWDRVVGKALFAVYYVIDGKGGAVERMHVGRMERETR